MGANQSAIDSSSAETRCVYLLGYVVDVVHGAIIHGNCHYFGENVLEETRKALQIRAYTR